MSGDFRMAAAHLVSGEHQIRVPGQCAWLGVESVTPYPLAGNVVLVAGGRAFVTSPRTPWPCRVIPTSAPPLPPMGGGPHPGPQHGPG